MLPVFICPDVAEGRVLQATQETWDAVAHHLTGNMTAVRWRLALEMALSRAEHEGTMVRIHVDRELARRVLEIAGVSA